MKSSFHRPVSFFPLFCNWQFRRLDSIQFLCSPAHTPAGWLPKLDSVLCCSCQSEFESYITTDSQSASLSWKKAPIWGLRPDIYMPLIITALFLWASSLTRGRVWLLYMLLALASVVFLGSEFLWTRNRILLSQIWDFPFRRLLRLAGSRWRYSTPPPHRVLAPASFGTLLYNHIARAIQKTSSLLLEGRVYRTLV
jgi:hypothetical protein